MKLNRKSLYPSKSVNYRGIKIDEILNWKQNIHNIVIKPNRANTLLFTIRNYVGKHILRTIYFAMFDFQINYANLTCSQSLNAVCWIVILQNKALKTMNCKSLSLETLTKICYLNPTIFWNLKTKYFKKITFY